MLAFLPSDAIGLVSLAVVKIGHQGLIMGALSGGTALEKIHSDTRCERATNQRAPVLQVAHDSTEKIARQEHSCCDKVT